MKSCNNYFKEGDEFDEQSECDGINTFCGKCGNCWCYCECPCEHLDVQIVEVSDGLMINECVDCESQIGGFIGQFGNFFNNTNEVIE